MKFLQVLMLTISFASSAFFFSPSAFAEGCYLCGSGGSCNQCRYGDKDTQEKRKACEAKGCKVTGTGGCSTAANVKVCAAPKAGSSAQVDAWLESVAPSLSF